MSTNKVYGDRPNTMTGGERKRAGTTPIPSTAMGIPESFSIDQSLHSLFGASKVAADVMVQEYGRYFGMPTCCLTRRLPDRAESFRRRTAWISQLSDPLQPKRQGIQGFWLQGQTSPRQHSL